MIKFFEYLRLVLVAIGINLAYIFPGQAPYYLLCGMTLPLYGLLAVQATFFPQASADYLQRQANVYSRYQMAAFWASIFLVGVGALVFHASVAVQLTLVLLTLIGFFLSGMVHLLQYIQEKEAPRVHLWRIIGSVLMCALVLYVVWPHLVR